MREEAHEAPAPKEPMVMITEEEASHTTEMYEQQPLSKSVPAGGNDFGAMPSPIRYFSYFFFTSSFLLLIIGILYQLFK